MKPRHIDPNCPECGAELVLSDLLDDPDAEEVFEDKWACPKCYDGHGVYMDWPQEQIDELAGRARDAEKHPEKLIPWEEVRHDLYKDMGLTDEEIEEEIKKAEEKTKNMTEEEIAEFQSKVRYLINIK